MFHLFPNMWYIIGDIRDVFIPLETFFQGQLLAGQLGAWNPDAAWGFPVLASAQIGFFYPPLLLLRWLPIQFYLPCLFIAHIAAAGLGTFFFLHRQKASRHAALLGALSFTLSGWLIQHTTHLNIIFAVAWFPWQLFAVQKVTLSEQSESKSNFVWLSMLLAIPFLAGQIQMPLLMALVTSAYFLTHSHHSSVIRKLASLAAVAILAIGLAAAQLLPTAELAWHSTRGADQDFDIVRANQYSYPIYHLPTLLFPRFFGSDTTYWGKPLQLEYGFFVGTIPLALALWAMVQRSSNFGFFRWLVIISFLLALGAWSPFRFLGIEPSLWLFSAPARWLLFTTFGLSILAAHGWDRISIPGMEPKVTPRGWAWVSSIIIILTLLFNLAIFTLNPVAEFQPYLESFQGRFPEYFARDSTYYAEKINSLLASIRTSSVSLLSAYTALPIIILAAMPFLINRRHGKKVLLAASAVELIVVAATAVPTAPWKKVFELPATVAQLPGTVRAKQARLHSLRLLDETGAFFANPESHENEIQRERSRQLLVPLIHTQFNLAGVAWPASLDLSENAQVLHELNESLKRGETTLAEELNVGAILHGVEVQVLHPAPRASLRLPDGREIPAEYREITPSHIQIKTSADEAGTLIVRDTFYPGWHATLDSDPGSEMVITRTDRIFRAVSLPPGDHIIEMKYVPRLLYIGLGISTASLLTAIGLLWYRREA